MLGCQSGMHHPLERPNPQSRADFSGGGRKGDMLGRPHFFTVPMATSPLRRQIKPPQLLHMLLLSVCPELLLCILQFIFSEQSNSGERMERCGGGEVLEACKEQLVVVVAAPIKIRFLAEDPALC